MGSKDASWEELAWESPCAGISSSTKISLNSCSHSGDFRIQRVAGFPLGFLFICFGSFLAWSISGRTDLSSTVLDTGTGEMPPWVRSSCSRVWFSLTVSEEDEPCLEKCPRSWWRSWRRTWQAWKHNRNEVLRVARNPYPVLMRCGFWPLIHS